MAASPNLLPSFETARCARLLTMRPSVLSSCQIAKIERVTASKAGIQLLVTVERGPKLLWTRKQYQPVIFNHRHDLRTFSLEPDMPVAVDLIWLSKLKVDF